MQMARKAMMLAGGLGVAAAVVRLRRRRSGPEELKARHD
jgi:hypothetical protein